MRQRFPPLNALRLFESAARLQSFKNAAEELSLTPSAVSHGVQVLENWLGLQLFTRTRRGLKLSEAGKYYYPVVQEAFTLLDQGTAQVGGHREGGRLAISVAPTLALRWLIPRLGRFREKHPDITLVIDTSRRRVELDSQSVDAAIRMGRGGWQGVQAEKLFTEVLIPVCSPEFAQARELAPSQLNDVPLIHVTQTRDEWGAWAQGADCPPPDQTRGLLFDSVNLAFEAAVRGLGIAMGRRPLVDDDLATGRLVVAFDLPVTSATAYWFLISESRVDDRALVAFRSWLLSECSDADATR